MCCTISVAPGHITIHLSGTIGAKEATSIRQELFPYIQIGMSRMTINLLEVTDMNSSGLGLLLAAVKRAEEVGAKVEFIHVGKRLGVFFQSVGIVF